MVTPQVPGGDDALKTMLQQSGLQHQETQGHYFGPEKSFIIYGPSRQQMYDWGKSLGQESVVFSSGGHHELLYTNGPNDGKAHPGLKEVGFHPTIPPPDYWTKIPQHGFIRLHFNQDILRPVPLAIKKSIGVVAATQPAVVTKQSSGWPGAYPWHEGHTSANHRGNCGGIVVDPSFFHHGLHKADSHPHMSAHGKPDYSGGVVSSTNDQISTPGSSKTYGRFAAPYGHVDKSSPSVLKFYDLEGKSSAVDTLTKAHNYKTYYAGGSHGKPDLVSKNYGTGHLMVYDPGAGSGGDFGETSYTDAWRKSHELAHALTYPDINQKYGEGRRIGSLGKHRTTREAKRAVEWEWMAAHKQRELLHGLGVRISDDDFHRELNTVMHDAVHRAVTGKFTDPGDEGFRPHPHKVPLQTAMSLIDEAAQSMGLKHEHDLLKSIFVSTQNNNLTGDKGITSMTKKEINRALAVALRDALTKHEAAIKDSAALEDLKKGTGAPPPGGMKSQGVGGQVPGPMGKEELDKCGDIKKDEDDFGGMNCPACQGGSYEHLGCLGTSDHFLCRGCGMSFSTPRQENEAADSSRAEEDQLPRSPDPVVGTARAMDKKEIAPTGTVDEKSISVPKSKKVDAPGSGGDITKSLRKDASSVSIAPSKKLSPPGLPGMTPPVGKTTTPNPGTAPTILDMKAPAFNPANAPTLAFPGRPRPFVRKPAADDPIPAKIDESPISHEEKRAAGIGFLSNLISKFRGAGNKTWSDLRGAGPSSAERASRTMATRMAFAEKSPTSTDQANKELKGYKSLASNPTAMPSFPGIKKPMTKAAIPSAPKAPAAPKPAVSAPTGPTSAPGPATGPAKPKSAPPSAMKAEIKTHDTKDKMDTLFGDEPKVLHPSDKKPKPKK
jgi:hypothetical protein